MILLAVVALVAWRVVRHRALSPMFVTLAVAVVSFWLLVAFGRAKLGRPWESHYVYMGTVVIVLILAESLRDARLTRRLLPLAVGLAAVALISNIRAFDGGESYLHTASTTVKAELGALELARATVSPGLIVDPHWAPQIQAGPYFRAVRALGSTPADSPSQLSHASAAARRAAAGLLVRAGALALQTTIAAPRQP